MGFLFYYMYAIIDIVIYYVRGSFYEVYTKAI